MVAAGLAGSQVSIAYNGGGNGEISSLAVTTNNVVSVRGGVYR